MDLHTRRIITCNQMETQPTASTQRNVCLQNMLQRCLLREPQSVPEGSDSMSMRGAARLTCARCLGSAPQTEAAAGGTRSTGSAGDRLAPAHQTHNVTRVVSNMSNSGKSFLQERPTPMLEKLWVMIAHQILTVHHRCDLRDVRICMESIKR